MDSLHPIRRGLIVVVAKVFLLLILVLSTPAFAGTETLESRYMEARARLQSCLSDLAVNTGKFLTVNELLPQIGSEILLQKSSVTAVADSEYQWRTTLLEEALADCHERVKKTCAVDLEAVLSLLDKKIFFVSNPRTPQLFLWNGEARKIYRDSIIRKLCSKALTLPALEEMDGIFLFNTECTGKQFFWEMERLKYSASITVDDVHNRCSPGGNTTSLTFTRPRIPSFFPDEETRIRYITIQGGAHRSLWVNIEANNYSHSFLDEALTHEFAHYERFNNTQFKEYSEVFLNFRFSALSRDFSKAMSDFNFSLGLSAGILSRMPDLADSQKTEKIKERAEELVEKLVKKLKGLHIPVHGGITSPNDHYFNGSLQHSNKTQFVNFPTVRNGKLENLEFLINGIDGASLVNKEEYFATVLALYRYNFSNLAQALSKEELDWLNLNWKFGFTHR